MNRIIFTKIAGKKYPLSFSLGASKAILKKLGSLDAIGEILDNGVTSEAIDSIIFMLETMMKQGCAYKNVFETDLPKENDADIRDGRYYALSAEEIELAIGMGGMPGIVEDIQSAIVASQNTELEVSAKNDEAPKAE